MAASNTNEVLRMWSDRDDQKIFFLVGKFGKYFVWGSLI